MKKVALILFGISYQKNLNHWAGGNYIIDFRKSFDNYKKYIYNYFNNLGYEIDVYIGTNILDDNNLTNLINMYKPIKYTMIENNEHNLLSKNSKLLAAIKCCLDSNIEYEYCIITRFDLLFQKDFATSKIDFNKINIVSVLENPDVIDDNLYIFPYKLLTKFYKLVEDNQYNRFHDIENQILKIGEINYILNEQKLVADLSFYKIVRTHITENFTDLQNCSKQNNNNYLLIFFLLSLLFVIYLFFPSS